MRIAVLGAGNVGGALATRFAAAGHDVRVLVRDTASDAAGALRRSAPAVMLSALPVELGPEELLFVAIPFAAAAGALAALDVGDRVVVDCTNPVGPGLRHGLDSQASATQRLQAAAPRARLVKAFNVYGFENFAVTPRAPTGEPRPVLPLAGDDAAARRVVAGLVAQLGFEPLDCGDVSAALSLEHLALLWIRLSRAGTLGSDWVWARLRNGMSAG